ncbi:MAG: T9SS type A sorting domain-containing protein [Bacteroidia bacterium]|nr:T9SS type A sorting domain-containing protein [Bacteroidia bacterium]
MKNLFLYICLLFSISLIGQNGLTTYAIPFPASVKTCIKIDALGNKWIGTQNRGLIKFDGTNFVLYDTSNCAIPAMSVNDLAFDSLSNLWMGSKKGLTKFDGTNWVTYNRLNSPLPSDSVYAVCTDGAIIWAGTHKGLIQFDGNNWTIFNNSNSNIVNEKIYCLNIDRTNGDIWMGQDYGLTIKSGNIWKNYTGNNSNLSNNKINNIFLENNFYYVSSYFDIFKYENNSFKSIGSRFQNLTQSLGVGLSARSLSLGPQGGILTEQLYEIVNYQLHTYDIGGTGGYTHIFENTSNTIWLAGFNSLYAFDYNNYTGSSLIPKDSSVNILDINNVRTILKNTGDMGLLEAPKNSSRQTVFSSGIWIGGLDQSNTLHQAAKIYSTNETDFQPGPLDTISGTSDSITAIYYNKIWKVDRLKIEEFQTMFANGSVQNGVYAVDENILTWPAHGTGNYSRNLAPFIDVNGDGIYNPIIDGDYPKIKGDQMCFWIFNDSKTHSESGGTPLNVEIHASAYAFSCNDHSYADSLNAINFTTFYNYKIINRSNNNYHNTKIGIYELPSIGFGVDYCVGSNKNENYAFAYNYSGFNSGYGTGVYTHHQNPPIFSTVLLSGPAAEINDGIDNNNNGIIDEMDEQNLMTNFVSFKMDTSVIGHPDSSIHYFNYLNSKWKDGSDITYGGNGYGGSIPYSFMYDGIPNISGWYEPDSTYYEFRQFVMGCGPFNLNAGESKEVDYARVFTRDSIAPSVYSLTNLLEKNKQDIRVVKQWFNSTISPSCLDITDYSCYSSFTATQDSNNVFNYFVYNSSSVGNEYTYLWDFGDGTTSTAPYPTHTYPGTGPYQICFTVSDNSGCSSTYCDSLFAGRGSGVLTINVIPPTSIENITTSNKSNINLYPNPASSQLTVQTNGIKSKFDVIIYDVAGRVVKTITKVESSETTINIEYLEAGFYLLNINDGKTSISKRFVKQ